MCEKVSNQSWTPAATHDTRLFVITLYDYDYDRVMRCKKSADRVGNKSFLLTCSLYHRE